MRIAVVGATGPTGRLVLERLLAHGHDVVAYVRRPDALSPAERLTIKGGELSNRAAFAAAIDGCDAIISTLGSRSWSERAFMATHLPYVTDAMVDAGVPRLVLMSALGAGPLPPRTRGVARIIFTIMSRFIFADRTCSEAELSRRGINWCGVYPGFLNDKPAAAKIDALPIAELTNARNASVSRANVADVLVQLAEDLQSNGKRLAVGPAGALS